MKLVMKNLNNICVALLILAFVLIIFYSINFYSSSNSKYKKQNEKSEQKIDIVELYKKRFSDKDFYIKLQKSIANRYIYINDETNEIIVGNNKKEIENGYFDVKITISKDNKLNIFINKLFKEKSNINGVYDVDYFEELFNIFVYYTKDIISEEEYIDIKNKVLESYINIRYVETVDNTFKKINLKCICLTKFNIELNIENNMLKVIM